MSESQSLPSRRIAQIDRIVSDIGVEVHLVLVADGVGLQEPSHVRIVEPRLVVIERKLRQPCLPRIAERPLVPRLLPAPGVVGVDLLQRAVVVGVGDDAAALVGEEERPRRIGARGRSA